MERELWKLAKHKFAFALVGLTYVSKLGPQNRKKNMQKCLWMAQLCLIFYPHINSSSRPLCRKHWKDDQTQRPNSQMRIPSSGLYKNQSICNIKLEFRLPEELSSMQALKNEERLLNWSSRHFKAWQSFLFTHVDLLDLSFYIQMSNTKM